MGETAVFVILTGTAEITRAVAIVPARRRLVKRVEPMRATMPAL